MLSRHQLRFINKMDVQAPCHVMIEKFEFKLNQRIARFLKFYAVFDDHNKNLFEIYSKKRIATRRISLNLLNFLSSSRGDQFVVHDRTDLRIEARHRRETLSALQGILTLMRLALLTRERERQRRREREDPCQYPCVCVKQTICIL